MMPMTAPLRTLFLSLVFALLAGCGSRGGVAPEPDTDQLPPAVEAQGMQGADQSGAAGQEADRAGAESFGVGDDGAISSATLPDLSELGTLVYFGFDDDNLQPEFRDLVLAHARYLIANPTQTLLLEGHTDERGTREYNLALGERRAKAVRNLLLLEGVPASRIRVVSYGEERPANPSHTEAAWEENRRVELKY